MLFYHLPNDGALLPAKLMKNKQQINWGYYGVIDNLRGNAFGLEQEK
jgi:hypothetical protein